MAKRLVFFTFVRDFLVDKPSIEPSFEVSDAVVDDFTAHTREREIEISDEEVAENRDFIKRMIKYEVFYNRRGVSEAARVLLNGDEQILKALELMPEAGELSQRAHSAIARRQ